MKFNIEPVDEKLYKAAIERQRNLAKPFGSLGQLENFSARIASIRGELFPSLNSKAVVVFAADNGVWEEGVTPIGQDVTMLQSANMTYGKAGIGVLSAFANCKLYVVDVGMAMDSESRYLISRKIRRGTSNIAKGPAMSREECEKAFAIGDEMAQRCFDDCIAVTGVGEMGVGNTTTSSAILSAMTNKSPREITGKGAGLTDEAYSNKISVIQKALDVNSPDSNDPFDIVSKVGGFDLAAMAGFMLGCATRRIIVVVDGFISISAALLAYKIDPFVKDYMFLSHRSAEPGYDFAAEQLGLKPMFDLEMRLGEGTGCPLAFNFLEASVRVLRDMATFSDISIDSSVVVDNWDEDSDTRE